MSVVTDPPWLSPGTDTTALLVTGGGAPAGLTEVFVRGKSDASRCEDIIVVTPRHVAVLDGMSTPLREPGQAPSGRAFAATAAAAIGALPARATAYEAGAAITRRLAALDVAHTGPAGAVAAIYSAERNEVWRVGDIHIAINGKQHPGRKDVDVAMARYRAAVNSAHLTDGMLSLAQLRDADPGLAAARPLLAVQPALANRTVPYGYGVLDGTRVPDVFVEVFPVPHPCWVVLASDGFLTAAPTLDAAQSELDAAIATDPACIGALWEMGKALRSGSAAPDDRSYARLRTRTPRKDPS
ncbi:hypothetical protein ATY41_08150 [Leifsonia xyli subsp. xyli]|uniref:PPM-type phosphatase domain-containing protein n=2 Tax=Leifsonia xyli subsp. xyli TaxID=59736 RepID=Q6AEH0_LEIXX|nr:hypothetical protein [Leifsonia xyli]AAT89226.1 hypothetical protein Lxx14080 [Leifsonia xyli subsp. xyli str. CTCB07]ODA90877.1 hypothetical protein ATY41_08150 [Leifsonia xyli subsp. xyli]